MEVGGRPSSVSRHQRIAGSAGAGTSMLVRHLTRLGLDTEAEQARAVPGCEALQRKPVLRMVQRDQARVASRHAAALGDRTGKTDPVL
jgi:hypothetical protein